MAERFAASLGVGLSARLGQRTVDGAVMVGPIGGGVARSWRPARTSRGDHVLFTGHIDNRADLIRDLSGSPAEIADDAALYAACYDAYGDGCDLRVVGSYATILWSPEAKSVRLARSPLYAPPLHIWRDAQRVIVASVPRALFASGEVVAEVDEQKLADTLFLNYAEAERSWYKGVARLPTGARAVISRDGIQTTEYYDPFSCGPVRYARDEEYVEAATALFDEATEAALCGFSKPAVSLSGGYDSQAVAAFALKALPESRQVHGFTSVPEPGWDGRTPARRFGDESLHVEALAGMYPRLVPNFVDAAGLSFDHKLDAMFLMSGTAPRNAMNLHWIHEVNARAKAAGCDVVLNGALGNMTFSFDGEGAFPTWILRGKWGRAARELWAGRKTHASLAHGLYAKIMRPLLPSFLANGVERIRFGCGADPFQTWCPLNADWAADMKVAERAKALGRDADYFRLTSTKDLRALMHREIATEAGDIVQAMDLIGGLPTRDPTGYRPLVEFCFNIPDEQYIRSGQSRWLARRMLQGMLPAKVLNETRRGLQGADWHLRLSRQRENLQAEIEMLADDPKMAAMLNLPRLRGILDNWPAHTPLDRSDPAATAHLALSRALTTARFVRHVSGANR